MIMMSMPGGTERELRYHGAKIIEQTEGDRSLLEEEGILGLSAKLVTITFSTTTNITVALASSVRDTIVCISSGASSGFGWFLPRSKPRCIQEDHNFNATFKGSDGARARPVVLEIVSFIPEMILSALSPKLDTNLLSCRDANSIRFYTKHTNAIASNNSETDVSLLSDYDDNVYDTDPLSETSQIDSSSASYESFLSTSSRSNSFEIESVDTTDVVGIIQCEQSVVHQYHNNGKIKSHEDSATPINSHSNSSLDEGNLEMKRTETQEDSFFYLMFSDILSCAEDEKLSRLSLKRGIRDVLFFALDRSHDSQQFCYMLDMLVDNAMMFLRDDSGLIGSKCPEWKPEGDTKKAMRLKAQVGSDEWAKKLETSVLKWTSTLKNTKGEHRMLKTQGIINMSPAELNELLIDCSKGHLINKNSSGKEDLFVYPSGKGWTAIVRNTMSIPIVGGEIQSLCLTHSRRIETDSTFGHHSYVVVSKSVQKEITQSSQLPYFSCSLLSPVKENPTKTNLINVALMSSVPVPRIIMNKIAFVSAIDFFRNVRSLCQE